MSLCGERVLSRLHLQFRSGLGLGADLEFFEILPIANGVTENLVFTRKILRWAMDIACAIPGRRLESEEWIDEMRAAESNEIGAAGREDRVDLIRGRDVADTHGGDAGLVAYLIRKGCLEHAP